MTSAMTTAELLVQYRTDYGMGQPKARRDLIAMAESPDESGPDFLNSKIAVGRSTPAPVDGEIDLFQMEPLYAMQVRNQMGLTAVLDYFDRAASLPVPQVFLLPDGSIDPGQAQATLDALHAAYPISPDFLLTAKPFSWISQAAPLPQPRDGIGARYAPLDSDRSEAGSLFTDPYSGWGYQKQAFYGNAGANGVPVFMWVRTR